MAGSHKIDFTDIKRTVSIEQVVSFLGIIGLKPKGAGQWKGMCPFCKTADCFVVSNAGGRDKSGAFNCFKCPAGGDQIELVSLVRGHARKDSKGVYAAAKELHEKFLGSPSVQQGVNTSQGDTSPLAQHRETKGVRCGGLCQNTRPGA